MKTATTKARLQDFSVNPVAGTVVDLVHIGCGDCLAMHAPSVQDLIAAADAHACPPRPATP